MSSHDTPLGAPPGVQASAGSTATDSKRCKPNLSSKRGFPQVVVSFDEPFARPALVYKSSTFVPKPKEATRSPWKTVREYFSMSRQVVDLPWNLVGRALQGKFEAANGRNQKDTAGADSLECGHRGCSSETIERLAFDPTGRIMAFATNLSQIYLFDIDAQRFLSYCLTIDSPSTLRPERITALCFDSPTTLVVGLFSGEVELWTLKGPRCAPPRRPETSSKPSIWFGSNYQRISPPPPQHIPSTPDATCRRLSLIPPSPWAFHLSICTGVVTHFALSPTERTIAIATTHSGIWLYNRITRHTYHLYLPPAGVHFTSIFWAPHPTSTPLHSHTPSLSLATETLHTAIITSTSAGQILYFRLRDCGTRLFFHHDPLVLTHPDFTGDGDTEAGGIAQVVFIPPTPKAIAEATRREADLYPILAVAMSSVPAIYIYTLCPEEHRPEKRRSLRPPVFLTDRTPDPEPLGLQRIAAVATTFAHDYGGLVWSMAMDPAGGKLLASFEHEGTRSAVWFDVGGVYGEDAEVKAVAVEEEGVGREVVFAGCGEVGGYTLAGGGVRVVNLTTVAQGWER